MRLTVVTLSGFKSFAKKTVIDVRKNITGIVGPNGSGKSNIAEAIRFVLGEQSMKSMRGNGGSDLIFKGSNGLAPLARAVVSLTLSNTEKKENAQASERIAPFLVYEEIVLSREIFADGGSDYTINGAKVRLKDVEELLALAGVGNNKHTILNQGEADRVLLVNPKERKSLIEDALGLKVFQIRIDESKKKLEKTHRHLDEVKALEREIKPHFLYLERQLEKIKKFAEEKERFKSYAKIFFYRESLRLQKMKENLKEVGSSPALELLLTTLEKDIRSLRHLSEKQFDTKELDIKILFSKQTIATFEREYREKTIQSEVAKRERVTIQKELLKIERGEIITYEEEERLAFRTEMFTYIDGMKETKDFEDTTRFHDDYDKSKLKLNLFLKSDNRKNEKLESLIRSEKEKEEEAAYFDREKNKVEEELSLQRKVLQSLEEHKEKEREVFGREEKRLYTMRAKVSELRGTISAQKEKEYAHVRDMHYFETLLKEAVMFIGNEAKEYPYLISEKEIENYDRYEALRLLEKSKLRLEEGGVESTSEIEVEYEKVKERSLYLQKEIADILSSEKELEILIDDVRSHMKREYEAGIKKVSESFSKYFAAVFKGGEAKLVQKIYESDDEDVVVKEEGIDIDVKLPAKKVRSIAAFSGGEKALTAIALLFALAEVNPPPFIVLDETDAPLDEHNAKRYGETLALLSEKSKLLVITHNRETMSHCEMLYGVTLGADGASKLLSVDLK